MKFISKQDTPRALAGRAAWRCLAVLLALAACGVSPVRAEPAAAAWWSHDWAFRKQITVRAPAGSSATLTDVPVLIRIHEGVLNFADAAEDGADLRFVSGADAAPLDFHIEKFDPVFNLAYVWVRIPQLAAATPATVWMYYGNPKASAGGDSGTSWDASQALVYHFGENGTPARDASSLHNDATTLLAADDAGLIGSAARFDGQSVLTLPAAPSLQVRAGDALTVSLWVKPSSPAESVLYARRDGAAALVIGLSGGVPYAAVTDEAGETHQARAGAPLAEGEWHHLAVTAGAETVLFVDGAPQPALALALPPLATPATLGGEGGAAGAPVTAGFVGEIDELRIARVARDPAQLGFAADNEGPRGGLVEFGVDEQQSSWSTGYVGIILGSVTLDGWVIIGVLIAMMVLSWYVMVVKTLQIGRVARANSAFLQLYRRSRGDFAALNRITDAPAPTDRDAARERRLVLRSPLLHLFRSGIDELRERLDSDGDNRYSAPLSPQSIEAIRASIDSGIVQESHALGSRMVLLTIAISGGPFIGLLGTVVGVMITFAGVAAAGDVNINAIAPGISAALAATVAGLFVAIPALFGYNYLLTRIKECSADMQVFVDSFITRMAECYDSPAALHAMADRARDAA